MSNRDADEVLAVLARERAGALFGCAYVLTGDRGAAERLVREALIRTLAGTRRGVGPDEAERAVRRAIVSAYLDGERRAARQLNTSSYDEPTPVDPRLVLLPLSPTERAAALLYYGEDLSVSEVASQLRLAEETVERLLSDARLALEPVLGHLPEAQSEVVVQLSARRPR